MASNELTHLVHVQVVDAIKRLEPTKHYIYSIWTIWSDGRKQLIFRRYSQFFDLQCKLLDKFAFEAGKDKPETRIIPFLPGKILFGRSHIKSVALDRLHPLNIYCQKLISLKHEISRSDLVISFFTLTNDDLVLSTHHKYDLNKNENKIVNTDSISKPIKLDEYICIHDYKAVGKTELSLKKNTIVMVVEKNLNGWWFVDSHSNGQGYVPNCVLRPHKLNDAPKQSNEIIKLETPESHIVTKDYKAKKPDEINLLKGQYVSVIEKNFNGWWTVKSTDNRTGLAPAVYLKPFKAGNVEDTTRFNSSIFQSSYLPPREDFFPSKTSADTSSSFSSSLDTISVNTSNYETDTLNASSISPQASSKSTSSQNSSPSDIEIYYAIDSYQDTVGDGVSLVKDEEVQVLEKSDNGWWYVRLENGNEGWAPSGFLNKKRPPRPPPPIPLKKPIGNPLNLQNSLLENKNENNSDEYKQIKVNEMRKLFDKR